MSDNDYIDGEKPDRFWHILRLFTHPWFDFRKFCSLHGNVLRQILVVFSAFATMVLFSYLFITQIIIRQAETNSMSVFFSVFHHASGIFDHAESHLLDVAADIEYLLDHDQSVEDIDEYLKTAFIQLNSLACETAQDNHYVFRKGRFYGDLNYTGVCCVLFGKRIDGATWEPPPGYDTLESVWYREIKDGNGSLVYPNHHVSMYTGNPIFSLGRALYTTRDDERHFVGVLIMEVDVPQIASIVDVNFIQDSSQGYAVLMCPHERLMAYHNRSVVGKCAAEVNPGLIQMANSVKLSYDFTHPARLLHSNRDGVDCVYVFGLLRNNWIIFSATPVSVYYRQIWLAGTILSLLGILMAGTVSFFLVRLYREKGQSDTRNRAKTMFLARMSHEIRTPMNVIAGLSQLIIREKSHLPRKIHEYSIAIFQAANNLLAIINDILDLTKIESGKLEIVKVPFTLASLLDDIVRISHIRVVEKGLQFISFVDSSLPNNLFGDVVHIRQILLNLLGNAAKYTRDGYVAFDVIGKIADEKTAMISFVVRDTGVGIKPEDQTKLFDDFSQVRIESHWNVEGTGLGLSICRELVGKLNGSISLVSQYGMGTTFTVSLPIEMRDDLPCAVVQNTSALRVLIYEPRPIYEQSLARTLRHLGISFVCVRNISALNNLLQNGNPVSHIFVASFVYEEFSKFMESPALSGIQTITLYEGTDQYQQSRTRSMTLPINAIHIANIFNDIDDLIDTSDVKTLFKIPEARILIVDDNRANFLVIEGLLSPYDCQLDFALSGHEAIQRVQHHQYDLIFMDHMMPEMDGLETTRRIRDLAKKNEHCQYCKKVPIIALTANAVIGMRELYLKSEMDDFLSKPIDLMRLNEALATWIPKEKQQVTEVLYPESKLPVSETIQIPGVDTQVGIIQTGGTLAGYLRVIASLCNELETKVAAMEKALEHDDLPLYKVYVHSYKSFLATIGVQPLATAAAMLEGAAQNGDRTTINTHHRIFVRDLREVAASIATFLSEREAQSSSTATSAEDKNWLNNELTQLKTAITNMQTQQVDRILDGLLEKPWPPDVQERLEKILQCILLFEWSEAMKLIETLQKAGE